MQRHLHISHLRGLLHPSPSKNIIRSAIRHRSDARRSHDPLRVLFCGSDEFSDYSLQTLHKLRQERPNTIASIDVVCRTDKKTGRGLKHIQQVPIKLSAENLQLPLHQIDTFTGWTPPRSIDLVIAVSFGLLVPARILRAAAYGGLNVHPSLLPDLRGASPLQYALMLGRARTGVSVQTMHHTKFDHGVVLAQQSIDVPERCDVNHLVGRLGPIGARLLRETILTEAFLRPEPIIDNSTVDEKAIALAPKLTKEDAHIDWHNWTSKRIQQYGNVLELWDTTTYGACTNKDTRRVKFSGPWEITEPQLDEIPPPGTPLLHRTGPGKNDRTFAICTADGRLVYPRSASIEGKKEAGGIQALSQALAKKLNSEWS